MVAIMIGMLSFKGKEGWREGCTQKETD